MPCSLKNTCFSTQLEENYKKDPLLGKYHGKSVVTAFRYQSDLDLLNFFLNFSTAEQSSVKLLKTNCSCYKKKLLNKYCMQGKLCCTDL